MATHDPQDFAPAPGGLELALRDALRLGRHRVGVEHDHGRSSSPAPAGGESDAGLMDDSTFADAGALSDDELRGLIDRFAAREQVVSYERRMLHGRMDFLRAELVGRLRRRYGPTAPPP